MSLNVEAITSQKIAVGYVETPACERLRDFAAQVPGDKAIVEIGAYRGRSTGWLTLGATSGHSAPIFSVDTWDTRPLETWPDDRPGYIRNYPLSETREAYERHLDVTGIREHVTPICGWSTEVAKAWRSDGRPSVGLLFHDAAHHYEEVVADLKAWLPLMARNSVVTLHDAGNPNYGVYEAAAEVFGKRKTWDWDGRELQRWPKSPKRRGLLIVRSKA